MTTQPNAKKIFVLEDRPGQLETYVRLLESRGFQVRGARNREEVESAWKSDESFDLLLLDMHLKVDPGLLELNIYGSDVGEQLVKKQSAWPPEVLIMTQFHTRIDFWRRAFAVGAAAFLEKSLMSVEVIANHVYVMLLRRGVSLQNPRCIEAINEVLGRGGRERQVLEEFFRRLVLPEFEACLGSPFIMVLEHAGASAEGETGGPLLPAVGAEATLREQIVELVVKAGYYYQAKGLKEPLQLDEEFFNLDDLPVRAFAAQVFLSAKLASLLEDEKELSGVLLPELLEEAAFIPVHLTPDIRLSVLLVKEKKQLTVSKDLLPLALARPLAKYTLDPLRMTLTNLIERWKNEEQIKLAQLGELARFCEYVGAEAKRITYDAEAADSVAEKNIHLRRLNLLVDELSETAEFLHTLVEKNAPPTRRLILREVIQAAADSLGRGAGSSRELLFRGDCQAAVLAAKEDLLFIFSRLLHWLVSFYEDEPGATPRVVAECRLEGRHVEISLESDSARLHKILRDSLFVPMTQRPNYEQVLEGRGPKLLLSPYLAKSVLERRYQGSLADASDELPGEVGHRLVLRMPVLN